MQLRTLCVVLLLLFGLHGAVAVAQDEVELDLQVLNDDVRYFVALGTQILEFIPGTTLNEQCVGDEDPFLCCTAVGTGTCEEADPADLSEDSWTLVFDQGGANPIADVAYMPDGKLYFSIPASSTVGRVDPDGGTATYLDCADPTCEPTDLGVNYYGDLLAVAADTGGLLVWEEAVALCSIPELGISVLCSGDVDFNGDCESGPDSDPPADPFPYSCCLDEGVGTCPSFLNDGELIPGSADLGSALIANQEWYSGQMAVIRDAVPGSKGKDKTDPLPAQLLKADNPDYLTSFVSVTEFPLEGDPTDLTVSQAQAFYTEGKKLWRLDLGSGDSFACESFGNEKAEFVTGDVGGVVYVGTANNQDYRVRKFVWDGVLGGCSGTELELKRFNKNDWDRVAFGGVTTTYSTLATEVTGTPGETMVTKPDGMHYYRFTPENLNNCRIEVTPTLLETALAGIESSVDVNDPNPDVNDRLGLPFNLPGQSHPWQYEVLGCAPIEQLVGSEFHEFSTAVTGTNFRLACCEDPCTPEGCLPIPSDPDQINFCEWGALIYALPIASEIVPDPRGTRRGTGTACYESLTSTRNSNKPADFCGWNSPLVSTPPDPFNFDAFFCGPGVYSVTQGDTVPVKFNVGIPGENCSSNEDLPYDLNVLFSAGRAGSCVGGTFVPLPEVLAILGIEPNGEGEIDPITGQVKFATAGPKKQYHFNFNTDQVVLLPGSDRTIVLINATFLEDSIEDGDQSIFIAVEP